MALGAGVGLDVMALGFDFAVETLLGTAVGALFTGLLTAGDRFTAVFFSALPVLPDGAVASIMDWP